MDVRRRAIDCKTGCDPRPVSVFADRDEAASHSATLRIVGMNKDGNAPGQTEDRLSLVGLGLTTRLTVAAIIAAAVWVMILSVVQG